MLIGIFLISILFGNGFSNDSAETVALCGEDFAYHSGTMINDDAEANSPLACKVVCMITEGCAYWDYEHSSKICRLRSNAGSGKQTASGYSYGQKNCIFGIFDDGTSEENDDDDEEDDESTEDDEECQKNTDCTTRFPYCIDGSCKALQDNTELVKEMCKGSCGDLEEYCGQIIDCQGEFDVSEHCAKNCALASNGGCQTNADCPMSMYCYGNVCYER